MADLCRPHNTQLKDGRQSKKKISDRIIYGTIFVTVTEYTKGNNYNNNNNSNSVINGVQFLVRGQGKKRITHNNDRPGGIMAMNTQKPGQQ